jgi:hypothetical protein|tara:strand:- start:845 stop:1144 length:300 start_codon:yes stop_codon:yes gene_type:complete
MEAVQERVILVVAHLVVLVGAVQVGPELLEVQVQEAVQTRQVAGVVIQQYIIYFHLLEMVMTQQVEWEVVVDGLPMLHHLLAISTLVAVSMVAVAVEKV